MTPASPNHSSHPEQHPELAAEQSHVDRAYRRLDESRDEAKRLRAMVEVGSGGTNQARYEREVITDQVVARLTELDIGDRSICFGRIDQSEEAGSGSYHIGRVAVSDHDHEPLIVDWRAPVAEAFYRATGVEPRGLVRRRHFVSRGRQVLGLEDEFFGDAAGSTSATVNGRQLRGRVPSSPRSRPGAPATWGTSSAPSSPNRTRSSGPRCRGC